MRIQFCILAITLVAWFDRSALAQTPRAMPTNSVSPVKSQERAPTNSAPDIWRHGKIDTSVMLVPPQGWRVATNLGSIFFHHPNEFRPPYEDVTFIQFNPETSQTNLDVAAEWKESESTDRDNADEYKILSKSKLKVQGLEAFDFTKYCRWGEHKQIFRDVIIVRSNKFIGFHLCTETNDYQANNRVLNRVMDSFIWK
jgi:hypothetical protein